MTYEMTLLENRMEGFQRGQAEGRAEGWAKGQAKGRAEEKEAVALKMLRKGSSFEEVHEMTELPFKRIEELARNLTLKN